MNNSLIEELIHPELDNSGQQLYLVNSPTVNTPKQETQRSSYQVCFDLSAEENHLRQDYEKLLLTVNSMTDLSSIIDPGDCAAFQVSHKDGFKRLVHLDCRLKAKEVRNLNNTSHSVSAFMSIVALIGYLSKLAYNANPSFLSQVLSTKEWAQCQADQQSNLDLELVKGLDTVIYSSFIHRFLQNDNSYQFPKKGAVPHDFAWVFYKMVRCGLLHGESVGSAHAELKNVNVFISHVTSANKSFADWASLYDSWDKQGKFSLILNASDICDAIDVAVEKMFDGSEPGVENSIFEVFRKEPPILFLNGLNEV